MAENNVYGVIVPVVVALFGAGGAGGIWIKGKADVETAKAQASQCGSEKGNLETTAKTLREEVEHLQAERKKMDDALKRLEDALQQSVSNSNSGNTVTGSVGVAIGGSTVQVGGKREDLKSMLGAVRALRQEAQ